MVPDVRMSVEEYLALVEAAQLEVGSRALTPVVGRKAARKVARTGSRVQRKASGTALKGMSRALKRANKSAKLKNGKFRKGWNQRRLMKYAHKIRGKK